MITNRQIWIFREVYSEFHKKIMGQSEVNQTKMLTKALKEFYPEMSYQTYKELHGIDNRQRMDRILQGKQPHDLGLFLYLEYLGTEDVNKKQPNCPQLRCPYRSSDRTDKDFFNHVVKPTDLKELGNVSILLKKYRSEKYKTTGRAA